ncbi:uncharacterized protein LOC129615402 isoform X2 [Condylostylus longicornis]|uniref:uncharacterized protein LOC129615402 isoform X2 n=1 Tax=Condylostylus longicornis TaxID=2530218 RepID=UPI00244D9E07|nr:uncharacterized protein LOC129615402 isoform X2 [Condylostylus longicornis]
MPRKPSNEILQGDMNKWVNDALNYIEGSDVDSNKSLKNVVSNSLNKPIDVKKAAKKAKQKLKKEEKRLLFQLRELREQFHSIYFKEFEAKNELRDFKSTKKQDKRKILAVETTIKKLKKTKLKIEANILELICSLKTINPNFKFAYLPTKEEQQQYVEAVKVNTEKEEKSKNRVTSKNPTQLETDPTILRATVLNSDISGFSPLYSTSPRYFPNSISDAPENENAEPSKDLSERIVTIRRVYLPDSEAQVTVTAKGKSPDQDKLLYTFVNGQLLPANKTSQTKVNKKKETGTPRQSYQCYNQLQHIEKIDPKLNKTSCHLKGQISQYDFETVCSNNLSKDQTDSKEASNKKGKNIKCEIESFKTTKNLKTVKEEHQENIVQQKQKKKKSKKKKDLNSDSVIESTSKQITSNENTDLKNSLIEPFKLNFGKENVLTLVKLNGSDNVGAFHDCELNQEQSSKINQNFGAMGCDYNNHVQYKFNNSLENLCPAIKSLSLNSNNFPNSYCKSENPSIMEQLKQGVNVENLKLPPGISLTKVDPITSQALRVKQNSIQKLSQQINDIKINPSSVNNFSPIYPNIEITPHFINHDPSGLIMIDTNHSNLYKRPERCTQIKQDTNKHLPTTYQTDEQKNQEKSKIKTKKKNRKNKVKQNTQESNFITLKNPVFNNLTRMDVPPEFLCQTLNDDQPALITKNENGMFTIRNTALQNNFLGRYPYAGPGGILIPTKTSPSIPKSECKVGHLLENSCDTRKINYSYPFNRYIERSSEDHVCESSGY